MSNSCYICGDGSAEPLYCFSCSEYAKNKKDGFVKKYVNAIDTYTSNEYYIARWFESITEKIKRGYKVYKPSFSDLKELASIRRMFLNAQSYINDPSNRDKARAEIAIYELIKAIGETNGITKQEIESVIKLPSNRFIAVNKLCGYRLKKRGGAFLYGKTEIEMLISGVC